MSKRPTPGLENSLISDVRYTAASRQHFARGLCGWVTCTVSRTLRLDGLAVRCTLEGRYAISFPARRDAKGRQHFVVRPVDDRARRLIEREILAQLGFVEGKAP